MCDWGLRICYKLLFRGFNITLDLMQMALDMMQLYDKLEMPSL